MLYAVNPVGFVSVLLSAGISIAIFFGAFGSAIRPFSPVFAILIVLLVTPADGRPDQGQVPPATRR